MEKKFTHLHLHTEYSLLDGYSRIDRLLDYAVEQGMDSIAITDHGSMFGVIEFYKEAKKRKLKPIIGCEVYVTPGDHLSKTVEDKTRHHLVLLAENQTGYENLIKIVSEGYVNGFYYKPRVDKDVLRAHSQGIIALSACLGGEVPRLLREGQYDHAKKSALEYREIFGKDNYFLELQDHGLREQKQVNMELNRIHEETGIPLVATNDVHFVKREDYKIHDVLLCIQTGSTVNEEKRMRFPNDEFYLKNYEEMAGLFSSYEGALENTQLIADRCNVEFEFHKLHLPHFEIPEGYTNISYLRDLVYKGLEEKYGEITTTIRERAEFELKTIEDMGFVDYFLIVWDFIAYAKGENIPVGPGRGSAAGSIISYALDITGIDPLKYNLLFERFLNPARVSMPDIDIDFCYERRDEVIEYVKRKYGEEKVAQIVTFGTMAARNSIRDVGRAMEIEYAKVDKIAKQVPTALGMTIEKALDISPEFKALYEEDEVNKKLIDYAKAVEGMPRHTSTHAAGVVIASKAVDEFVPLSRNGEQITTQYNMIELEELGLLKMDFLGLRTLTVIQDAIDLVKINHGITIDIDKIDVEDPEVMRLFNKAQTIGIFQFESDGMRAFLRELKPSRFDDLVAANSLFRPGPMNEIPNYINYRHNPENIKYIDPSLESILDVTYGTIVYQEQVMQIVQKLAGFSLGEADNLRRAMGKKKMEVMEENRKYFVHGKEGDQGEILVRGCVRNGIDEDVANKIYDLMIDFAKYAFNKSHSVAYAFVAMQTAYLKHYYPKEFMAALLSSVMGDTAKVQLYIKEARRLKIKILPPHINKSFRKFSVEKEAIRMGLSTVKNVGTNIIHSTVEERKKGDFLSFSDYIERISLRTDSGLNKKAVESLILAGAFDEFGLNRSQMMAVYINVIDSITNKNRKNVPGQTDMFGILKKENQEDISIPDLKEYRKRDLLKYEKEVLGIYITDHPFRPYEKYVARNSNFTSLDLVEKKDYLDDLDNSYVRFGGIITNKKELLTKNNKIMAFLTMEDLYGSIEVIVFPDIYARYRNQIQEEAALLINGQLQVSDVEDAKIIMRDARVIDPDKLGESDGTREKREPKLYIQMDSRDKKRYLLLKENLLKSRGDTRVVVYFQDRKKAYELKDKFSVDLDQKEFIDRLKDLMGKENVKIN